MYVFLVNIVHGHNISQIYALCSNSFNFCFNGLHISRWLLVALCNSVCISVSISRLKDETKFWGRNFKTLNA